jgi:PTH2 family peptidyl-tRNA hydrolase
MSTSAINVKMVIVVNDSLNMRKGKLGAQVGHAASALFTRGLAVSRGKGTGTVVGIDNDVVAWLETGTKKIVVGIESEEALIELENACCSAGLRVERIIDSGLTEFGGVATLTCIAIGPAEAFRIDPFTEHLKLL